MTKAELTALKDRLEASGTAVHKACEQQRAMDAAHQHPLVRKRLAAEALTADRADFRQRTRAKLAPEALPALEQARAALALEGRLTSRDAVLSRARFTPEPEEHTNPRDLHEFYRPPMSDGHGGLTDAGCLYSEGAYYARRAAIDQKNLLNGILEKLTRQEWRETLREAPADELAAHASDAVARGDAALLHAVRQESSRRALTGAYKSDVEQARTRAAVETSVNSFPMPAHVAELVTEFAAVRDLASRVSDGWNEIISGRPHVDADEIARISEHGPIGAVKSRQADRAAFQLRVDAYVNKMLRAAAIEDEGAAA